MSRISAAIIAAYGPASHSARLVRQLRAELGQAVPIRLYAGNPAGAEAIAAPPAGVTVVGNVGAAGLREALDASGDGPVLLLHDDIVLGPDAARRMLRAWQPDRVVVPWTNAPGTDHHLDTLARQRDLAEGLRRLAMGRAAGEGLHRIQSSCVLAERSLLLAEGVPRHVAAPGAVLGTLSLEFHAAKGCVAAHLADCRRREVPQERLAGKPLLVATLIVRDEEHMLPDCLASLRPVVDEIVVCDTGSVDRTVEIATSMGARVVHREWQNDFAWARNQAIEAAGDAWYVIVLDADERLECPDPAGLRRLLAQGVGEHQQFDVTVANAGLDRQITGTFSSVRVFRPDEVRYVGALHEQPTPLPGAMPLQRTGLAGLRVLHLGYDTAVMTSRDKAERNLAIARDAYEREQTPERALHYARSLMAADRDRPLQRELLEFVLGCGVERAIASYVLSILAEYDLRDDLAEDALVRAERALELTPADDVAAVLFAKAADRLGRPELVAQKARWRRAQPSPAPVHSLGSVTADALARESAARAAEGDVDGALADAARAIVADGLPAPGWAALTASLLQHRPDTVLTDLAPLVRQAGGHAVPTFLKLLPPALTAELAALTLEDGTATAESVEVGLIAAVLQGRADLVGRLTPGVQLLDPPVVEQVARLALERGDLDTAEALVSAIPEIQVAVEPLAQRTPRSVLILEDDTTDERTAAAVERCAEAAVAQGWTPIRHRSSGDSPFARPQRWDGALLPNASSSGLVEALRPEVVVFASIVRFQQEARALLFCPSARTLLIAPAAPFGPGDLLDAIVHPEDPGVEKILLELLTAPHPVQEPRPATIPPATPTEGLTSVVIVASLATGEQLDQCVDALRDRTDLPLEILVVGEDHVGPVTRSLVAEGVLRFMPGTGDAAKDANLGLAAARGDSLCLLDPGYEVTEGWLQSMRQALTLEATGLVGARLEASGGLQNIEFPEDDRHAGARTWAAARRGGSWQTARLAPHCVMARRGVLERLGGLDEGVDTSLLYIDELCERALLSQLRLRVADGSVLLRNSASPQSSAASLGWVTRAVARHHTQHRRVTPVLSAALVLSDGQAAPARATVQEALLVADRVIVLERGDLEATELAVLGIAPGAVEVRHLDWTNDDLLPSLVQETDCTTLLVLGAGERLEIPSYELARLEIETLADGPAQVPIGDLGTEVRLHPPTAGAVAHIGGAEGPVVQTFRIVPAP